MKAVAIVLNIFLLGFAGFVVAENWIPSPDEEAFWVMVLLVIAPTFTIVTLLLDKSHSWIALYFRRKAAEERRRIQEIEKDEGS